MRTSEKEKRAQCTLFLPSRAGGAYSALGVSSASDPNFPLISVIVAISAKFSGSALVFVMTPIAVAAAACLSKSSFGDGMKALMITLYPDCLNFVFLLVYSGATLRRNFWFIGSKIKDFDS